MRFVELHCSLFSTLVRFVWPGAHQTGILRLPWRWTLKWLIYGEKMIWPRSDPTRPNQLLQWAALCILTCKKWCVACLLFILNFAEIVLLLHSDQPESSVGNPFWPHDLCCCMSVPLTDSSTDSHQNKCCSVKRNRNGQRNATAHNYFAFGPNESKDIYERTLRLDCGKT